MLRGLLEADPARGIAALVRLALPTARRRGSMMSLTVDEILRGTGPGLTQSAGTMSMIPLLGEDDDTFAPPEVEVGTTGYGSVHLRNHSDRPMLVPPGAGWVVAQKAQDHAIGGGALLRPGEGRAIDTAMCIQQSQGGVHQPRPSTRS